MIISYYLLTFAVPMINRKKMRMKNKSLLTLLVAGFASVNVMAQGAVS